MASKRDRTKKSPAPVTPAPVAVIDTPAPVVTPVTVTPALHPELSLGAFGVTVPDGYVVPAFVPAFVAGFRAVALMPSATIDERRAVAAVFESTVAGMMPGAPTTVVGRHTGRFTSMPVFESQNTLYVCAALANVPVSNGVIMAAWRVELPNAKCDYLSKNYAWTTLSEYVNGRHNASIIPGGVDVVRMWNARNRVPVAPVTA